MSRNIPVVVVAVVSVLFLVVVGFSLSAGPYRAAYDVCMAEHFGSDSESLDEVLGEYVEALGEVDVDPLTRQCLEYARVWGVAHSDRYPGVVRRRASQKADSLARALVRDFNASL